MTTNPNPDRAHRAVLTVTVETRPDGGHYFDQADFAAHVAGWVRSALRDKHAVGGVTVDEQAAVSVVPPATNQTALRERIAEALVDWAYRSADRKYTALRRDETVRANAYSRADAVLAVLPAPVDQAAVLNEAATRYEEILANADTGQDPRYWTAVRDVTLGLRAMAAEAPHAETPDEAPPREPHPTEADLRHALAVLDRFHGQDSAEPAVPETVHACPPDGSGLTPCCGRTPFELPRTDRISSEPAAITCAPAVVAQPGKDPS